MPLLVTDTSLQRFVSMKNIFTIDGVLLWSQYFGVTPDLVLSTLSQSSWSESMILYLSSHMFLNRDKRSFDTTIPLKEMDRVCVRESCK